MLNVHCRDLSKPVGTNILGKPLKGIRSKSLTLASSEQLSRTVSWDVCMQSWPSTLLPLGPVLRMSTNNKTGKVTLSVDLNTGL